MAVDAIKDVPDRRVINLAVSAERAWWCYCWNITDETLVDAVRAVGNDSEAVARQLNKPDLRIR